MSMRQPSFTESLIRSHTTSQVFERAETYYRTGRVGAIEQRGNELVAEVEGSEYLPYRVRIVLEEGIPSRVTCTCPYDWGGWCKHAAAVLLAYLRDTERIEERPALAALIDRLERTQLVALLQDLTERHPELASEIESWLTFRQSAPHSSKEPTVDPAPIRRRVRDIMRSPDHLRASEAYWYTGSVIDAVEEVLGEVEAVLARGAAHDALLLLEAITDEYVRDWTYVDYEGESYGFFERLAGVWTEAFLSAELDDDARWSWVEKLDAWQEEIEPYGIEEIFNAAYAAARKGWDDPWLQRVLRGDGPGDYADYDMDEEDLVEARLNVLERQGRHEEFLRLADAMDQEARRAMMLVHLGRVDEARRVGMTQPMVPAAVLNLAQALDEQGATEAALEVAEHGLASGNEDPTSDYNPRTYGRGPLAAWLRDRAAQLNQPDRALQAAVDAFKAYVTLDAYRRIEELAGPRWLDRKRELLAWLRQPGRYVPAENAVTILLHEGCVDDAIEAVTDAYASYDVLRRVADAAITKQPDWVIETARRHAEEIMNQGRSQAYEHAVDWLRRARDAYQAAGRVQEWQMYHADLLVKHERKYKLRPMLEALRR